MRSSVDILAQIAKAIPYFTIIYVFYIIYITIFPKRNFHAYLI